MKYSKALRKAATIFKPVKGVWFKSDTEACAIAAIAYVMSGATLSDIKDSFGKADNDFPKALGDAANSTLRITTPTLPVSNEEMIKGWNKFWEDAGNKPLPFPKTMSLGCAIMILNDGLGMEWSKMADWLEANGQ